MIKLPIDRNNVNIMDGTIALYDAFKDLKDDEKEIIFMAGRLFEDNWEIENLLMKEDL